MRVVDRGKYSSKRYEVSITYTSKKPVKVPKLSLAPEVALFRLLGMTVGHYVTPDLATRPAGDGSALLSRRLPDLAPDRANARRASTARSSR